MLFYPHSGMPYFGIVVYNGENFVKNARKEGVMNTPVRFSWQIGIFMASACFSAHAFSQTWTPVEGMDGVEKTVYDGVYGFRIETALVGKSIMPQVSVKGDPGSPTKWAKKHGLNFAVNANFYSMADTDNICSAAVNDGVCWNSWTNADYAQIGFTKNHELRYERASSTFETCPTWMYHAVSGTPEFVVNGSVVPRASLESACQSLNHCDIAAHRTAIGTDKAKKYLIMAVTSKAKTVTGMASTMKALGCDYAINLDGGGSSAVYCNGATYGNNRQTRNVAVNLGFKVGKRVQDACSPKLADNPSDIFKDISTTHWGLAAAAALQSHGITNGCQTNPPMFCAECAVTRVDAAVFIYRALKTGNASFKDAPTSQSAYFSDAAETASGMNAERYKAVQALAYHGIIRGDGSGTFRPKDAMTRLEGAAMLASAYIDNLDAFGSDRTPTPQFDDVPPSHWGFKYVEALVRNCIANGTDIRTFGANQTMSRIQFAVMLARAAGYVDNDSCAFKKACGNIGKTSCENGVVTQCLAYESVSHPCPDGAVCSGNACVPKAECAGNGAVCDGVKIKQCVNGRYEFSLCPSQCEDGRCVSCLKDAMPTCVDSQTVKKCQNGDWENETCPSGESCLSGECIARTCEDGTKTCIGNGLYQCHDGEWIETDPCDGRLCRDGACVEIKACHAESPSSCDTDGRLHTCSSEGQWIVKNCPDGEICRNGACVSGTACVPSAATSCDAHGKLQTCSDKGVWVTRSCDQGMTCLNGDCIAAEKCRTTAPGRCDGSGNLLLCADNGQWVTVSCLDGTTCHEGVCSRFDECQKNTPDTCEENGDIKTCANGKWAVISCGNGKTCRDGHCAALSDSSPSSDSRPSDYPKDGLPGDENYSAYYSSACSNAPSPRPIHPWWLAALGILGCLLKRRKSL